MGSNGGASQSERVGKNLACACGHPAFNHYPSIHKLSPQEGETPNAEAAESTASALSDVTTARSFTA